MLHGPLPPQRRGRSQESSSSRGSARQRVHGSRKPPGGERSRGGGGQRQLPRTVRGVDRRTARGPAGSPSRAQTKGYLVVIHQYCCMLAFSVCSPPASPPQPERQEMETDPAASAAVTIAVAGTAPSAGVIPPPTTRTPQRAMRVKKAVMKKSML
jgi:hypothetical protein